MPMRDFFHIARATPTSATDTAEYSFVWSDKGEEEEEEQGENTSGDLKLNES